MSPAPCHPDRPLLARGMCNACYSRWKRQQPHDPARPIKRYNYLPEIPDFDRYVPPPVPGVVQYAFVALPEACPKCHSTGTYEVNGREFWCRGTFGGCGFTAYFTLPSSETAGRASC